MKRYILTGTPGCGKTTLIHALEAEGYPIIEEAATDVIALKQAEGVTEPWTFPDFVDTIMRLQKQRQLQSADLPHALQFYDRSPICCYALAQYLGFTPSPALLEEIYRIKSEHVFERDVFFINNLGFCEQTAARKISFEQSLVFEKLHTEAYISFGYNLIEIPKKPIKSRIIDILRHTS